MADEAPVTGERTLAETLALTDEDAVIKRVRAGNWMLEMIVEEERAGLNRRTLLRRLSQLAVERGDGCC